MILFPLAALIALIAFNIGKVHGENSSDSLSSAPIRSYISAIFKRVNNVDIVFGDDGRIDQAREVFRNKTTVRIYGEPFSEQRGCTVDHRMLSDEVHVKQSNSHGVIIDPMGNYYEEGVDFVEWDRSYETFVEIWDQNQHDGYVVFSDLDMVRKFLRCLFDPRGTYLIVLAMGEEIDRDAAFQLLESIWKNSGAYRLFFLADESFYAFDPFSPNGLTYGILVEVTSLDAIPRTPYNFKGYPLQIEMFWSTYTVGVVENRKTVDFLGADAEASKALVKALNFTAIRVPPDNDVFGDRLPNGSFTGALGRLSRHKSDIAFVGYFIKDYYNRDIEFTSALYTDQLCCVVKKARRVPDYLLPITVFPRSLWKLLVLMALICVVAWIVIRTGIQIRITSNAIWVQRRRLAYLFNLSPSIRDAPAYRKVIQVCIDTCILLAGAPYRRFTRSSIERLFLFGILMVSLIFVFMFQSGLASVFVTPVFYNDINSLQQLDQSGLKISVKYRGFLDDVFPANYSAMMNSLRSKMIYERIFGSVLAYINRMGNISTVTRRTTLNLDNAIYLSTQKLHMIPECPRMYNLAYVVTRHSVLLDRINMVLMWMLNGGLINHWIEETNYNVTLRDMDQVRSYYEPNFKVLTLVDMQFPFYVLLIGLAISTGVFTIEHIYYKFRLVK